MYTEEERKKIENEMTDRMDLFMAYWDSLEGSGIPQALGGIALVKQKVFYHKARVGMRLIVVHPHTPRRSLDIVSWYNSRTEADMSTFDDLLMTTPAEIHIQGGGKFRVEQAHTRLHLTDVLASFIRDPDRLVEQ